MRQLLGAARADVAAVDEAARRRLRWALIALAVSAALAVLLSVAAVSIAVASSTTRAEEVAAQVAPEVIAKVVADSRAQRIRNGRDVLAAANRVLDQRKLPTVADPGPMANAEQILAAASTAQVLAVLPEDIATRLRDQRSGQVVVLPTALGTVAGIPPSGSSVGAAPSPGPGPARGSGGGGRSGAPPRSPSPGGSGGGSAGGGSGGSGSGGGGRPPAPAPAPTQRRLLPILPVPPIDLPLVGPV